MAAVGRLRSLTPEELVFRLAEELRFARERAAARNGTVPNMGDQPPDETVPRILFVSLREPEASRRLWLELFPESARESIMISDQILRNRLPLFSDVVDFGAHIDWHVDYRSRKRAPLTFYRDLHRVDPRAVGDTKNIWELSRQNFLLHLGKAYFATGEKRYYEKWKEIILSWIESNPYNLGINWESSIELAIRGINWIWSSWFFIEELKQDPALREVLYAALSTHARHIHDHLSFYFSPNTHLTCEALGLVYIGASFPSIPSASRWVARGFDILERELARQVLDDGGYFEMATYYHKYTIDFYLQYLVLREGRERWGSDAESKIKKLITHLVLIAEPDGTIPLIGDSDGGELLHLGRNKRAVRGACCAAAALLGDSELASLCGDAYAEEALWLLGTAGFETFGKLNRNARRATYHSINRASGIFCFRTGMGERDAYVVIDCGLHGWRTCGHAHADLLSFEWYCDGAKVVVDPGTYTYKGSRQSRDAARSSQRHNTITIDGVSQSIPGDTFKWKTIARPKRATARTFERCGLFEGEHDAYEAIGCRHRRSVLFLDTELTVVVDFVKVARPRASLLSNLQFGEGTLERIGAHAYRFISARNSKSYYVRFMGTRDFDTAVEESEIYPDYNRAVSAPRLMLTERDLRVDQVIVTLLGTDSALLQSFNLGGDMVLKGSAAERGYEIRLAPEGIDTVFIDAKALQL